MFSLSLDPHGELWTCLEGSRRGGVGTDYLSGGFLVEKLGDLLIHRRICEQEESTSDTRAVQVQRSALGLQRFFSEIQLLTPTNLLFHHFQQKLGLVISSAASSLSLCPPRVYPLCWFEVPVRRRRSQQSHVE